MSEIIKIFYFFSHVLNSSPNILPQESLQQIFEKKEASVQELNALAQAHFLRPKHAERMSPETLQHYKKLCAGLSPQQKESILQLFYELGYITSIYPKRNTTPDIILIQGSTVQNMRERLMFLAKMIENDIVHLKPAAQIIFLAGERPLFSTETTEILLNPFPYLKDDQWQPPQTLPHDEREAAKLIWAQLKLPSSLRAKKPLFIEAEKQKSAKRAQTMDCVKLWLKDIVPTTQKSVLMISNNPYIQYQKNVTELGIIKEGLADYFDVEGVGRSFEMSEENIDIVIGILMDTLARVLYIENQQQELRNQRKTTKVSLNQ